MICADLHCHTCYSHDSFAAVDAVLEQASRRGLTHLAITDHDEVEGALRALHPVNNATAAGCRCARAADGDTWIGGKLLQLNHWTR